jgi:uncharacterized protein (TIGR03118 family)
LVAFLSTIALAGCGAGPTDLGDQGAPARADVVQKLARTDLVSDQSGAATRDPNMVDAWGLAFNSAGPLWTSNHNTGLLGVYSSTGMNLGLVVTVPSAAGGTHHSTPTGQIFNATASFRGDFFIISTEEGTIAGWQPSSGTVASLRVNRAAQGAMYKGLARAVKNNVARLYAADFRNGKIDMFDANYAPVTVAGAFSDPQIPAGFAPFNVHAEGAQLFVAYAKQSPDRTLDVKGAGNGFVDVFDFDGTLQTRLVAGGVLNSPWGIAIAPPDFGALANQVLVANFGDGTIHAFNATTGAAGTSVVDITGAPLHIDGLWAIVFGNDTPQASHDSLFFTAGPASGAHGVLGRLDLHQ